MPQQQQPYLDMEPNAHGRSKKNLFAGLGASFTSKSKRNSIDELSQGNNAVAGQHVPSQMSGKGWMGSMWSKLKGGTSRHTTAPGHEETRNSEPSVEKKPTGCLLARDSKGNVLSDIKQARVKALQQDLLKLVKEAEKSGLVTVMRRQSTECISMPGHGVVRLAPPLAVGKPCAA